MNPTTDFRGMGILGLINLVDFINRNPTQSLDMLEYSKSKEYWYPFCVAGINITSEIVKKIINYELNDLFYKKMDSYLPIINCLYGNFKLCKI
jgi:hypothetical protein